MLILLFLIITIGAISQVSASDIDAIDDVISEDSSVEEVSSGEVSTEEVSAEQTVVEKINENDLLSSDENTGETVTPDSNTGETVAPDSNTEVPTVDQSSANDETVKPTVTKVKISAAKLTTIYKSTKKFKVKVLDSNNKAVSGLKLKIKVYTGKKYKTYSVSTNSKGIATLKVSALKLGKHKVLIKSNNALYSGSASSVIKINKRPVSIKVFSIKNKDFGAIYVTVKDKTLKKYVDKIPLKLLIYTGKKHKTYKLATCYDKDEKQHGALTYLTNAFSVGKHKIKLIAYGKYKGTKTSKITILKSAKRNVPVYAYSKNGKVVVYVKYKGKWIKA